MSSADWMPRNFFKRIEAMTPVLDGKIRDRITRELLAITLSDTAKASFLQPDGSWKRHHGAHGKEARCQEEFMKLATESSRKTARAGKKTGAAGDVEVIKGTLGRRTGVSKPSVP